MKTIAQLRLSSLQDSLFQIQLYAHLSKQLPNQSYTPEQLRVLVESVHDITYPYVNSVGW